MSSVFRRERRGRADSCGFELIALLLACGLFVGGCFEEAGPAGEPSPGGAAGGGTAAEQAASPGGAETRNPDEAEAEASSTEREGQAQAGPTQGSDDQATRLEEGIRKNLLRMALLANEHFERTGGEPYTAEAYRKKGALVIQPVAGEQYEGALPIAPDFEAIAVNTPYGRRVVVRRAEFEALLERMETQRRHRAKIAENLRLIAIAANLHLAATGIETAEWDEIQPMLLGDFQPVAGEDYTSLFPLKAGFEKLTISASGGLTVTYELE